MEIEKDGQLLTVNQLSDGEKCLIAMVSDLARRMAIANPTGDPLQGEGIILIDEIDLHLHPKWQRMIVPKLLEVFPNCQFIISTHSPHVLTHIQPENIFLLRWVDGNIKKMVKHALMALRSQQQWAFYNRAKVKLQVAISIRVP